MIILGIFPFFSIPRDHFTFSVYSFVLCDFSLSTSFYHFFHFASSFFFSTSHICISHTYAHIICFLVTLHLHSNLMVSYREVNGKITQWNTRIHSAPM